MMRRSLIIGALAVLAVLAVVGSSLAAGPTVITAGASNVFSSTAILGGRIEPAGLEVTSCYFRVALDPTLRVSASTHPCHEYDAGNGVMGASAVLSGLTPLTTYYYALVAGTMVGSTSGQTKSFATTDQPPPAPTATTGPATAVGADAGTLNGTVDAKNVAITDCEFDYGESVDYGQSLPCSPRPAAESGGQSTSAGASRLQPGTTYHFRILIKTEGGTAEGTDRTFTTAGGGGGGSAGPAGTAVTGHPTNLTATSAMLTGFVNAAGQSGDTCAFDYGTGTGYHGSVACPTRVDGAVTQTETAELTGLRPHTSYHYVLVLSTTAGPVDGRPVTFTTLTEPTGVTGRATGVTATRAVLNAEVDAHGAPVVTCVLQYALKRHSLGLSMRQGKRCSPRPGGARNMAVRAHISGLRPGSAYVFRVVLETQAGTLIAGTRSFVTTRLPMARIIGWQLTSRAASFSFRASGARATRYRCALAHVRRGRVARVRFRSCGSPVTYTGLRSGAYAFIVEAGSRNGYGPAATRRFTIRRTSD